LYIKFAIIFLKNDKVRNLFPKKKSKRRMRKRKLFKTNTQRYKQAGAELCQAKVKLGYPTRSGASRWRTGRNYGMSNDTFFLETTTAMTGEEMATVTSGGDDIALQPGPWGEEHLYRTLPILMGVVGLSRTDLAAAASSPLQSPSVGQDWELPAHSTVNKDIFTSHAMRRERYHPIHNIPEHAAKQELQHCGGGLNGGGGGGDSWD
jgi:hypothetical protein